MKYEKTAAKIALCMFRSLRCTVLNEKMHRQPKAEMLGEGVRVFSVPDLEGLTCVYLDHTVYDTDKQPLRQS